MADRCKSCLILTSHKQTGISRTSGIRWRRQRRDEGQQWIRHNAGVGSQGDDHLPGVTIGPDQSGAPLPPTR